MSTEIKVPKLPESVADATLVNWHKKPGDAVARDENLADLETDKVVLEVPAPVAGVLKEVKVQAGTTVTSDQLLAIIEAGAAPAAKAGTEGAAASSGGGKGKDKDKEKDKGKGAKSEPAAPAASAAKSGPAARRAAAETGVDVGAVSGSGRGGAVTKSDVLAHAAAGSRAERRVPMTRLRARIAERLVSAQATQALLTTFNEVDLLAVQQLRTRYRDLLVETAAPPSAGAVAVVQMLAMLEHEKAWSLPVESAAHLHLFAEVAKRAHAERRFSVVDPDSVADYDHRARLSRWRDPLTWLVPHPIDRQRSTNAAKLHRLYSMAVEELNNTTHFSVVDRDGNSVTCTTTLSAGFGAKYVVPGTGVVMNNSVGAFGTVGQDVLQPGRRMTSSMAPTLVSDNTGPVLLLGSPGGDTIPNTVVQVLRNLVDYNMPLDQAIEQPRIHHGFVPDAIRTERLRPIRAAQAFGRLIRDKEDTAQVFEIMRDIHANCFETADEFDSPRNYVVGANILGFLRVAEAMVAFGLI